jgi:tetratricopeptide (TPR) repeat protein
MSKHFLAFALILFVLLIMGCDYYSDIKDGLTYEEYISKANYYLNKENSEKAILAYQKALKIKPDDGKTHFALAELYSNEWRKSSDEATHEYIRDIFMNPKKRRSSNPNEELKKFGLKSEYKQLAIQEYKETIKYWPENWAARYHIAADLFNNRRYNEAIEEFKKVIDLNPEYSNSYGLIGEAYLELGSYNLAVEYLKRNIQIDPTDEYAYYKLGLVYMKMNTLEVNYGDEVNEILKKLKEMHSSYYDELRLSIFSSGKHRVYN